jgi:hypothetical protein
MKNVTVIRSNDPSIPEGPAPSFIRDRVLEQPVFFNDTSSRHWFFDFKIGDLWISSITINNELTEFNTEVFNREIDNAERKNNKSGSTPE